jgi:cytoskeletal protein CcmA (bactofilin family)
MSKLRYIESADELATIIGHESLLEGKLTVKHSVRVDGRILGNLSSTETVTVGPQGEIEGDISGKNVIIGGKIKGSIYATGRVTLETTSTMRGDLKTSRLVIEEGAILNGSTEMTDGKSHPIVDGQ